MGEQNDSGRRLLDILHRGPGGQRIFVWRGPEDARRLTEAVAEEGVTELFEVDGALIWRRDGQPIGVTRNVMHEIVSAYIVTTRLTEHGVEFYPFAFAPGADGSKEPDQQVLMILINDLKSMVAKGPSQPQRLPPYLHDAVRQRLAMGEPASMIAQAYKVDIATVKRLAGAG